MPTELNANEARIIACLIEKSIVTPDQYPMTLNALRNACNQKSSRDPMMSLTVADVQTTIRALEEKHIARTEDNFKSRTEKYSQRFCGTRYSDFQFDSAQIAVVCLLMLRGPQTPGELKARSGRLHAFTDNADVVLTLESLIERDGVPLVVKLPRTPGRRDSQYVHLFCGPVDVDAYESHSIAARVPKVTARESISELTERIEKLEGQVMELRALLG